MSIPDGALAWANAGTAAVTNAAAKNCLTLLLLLLIAGPTRVRGILSGREMNGLVDQTVALVASMQDDSGQQPYSAAQELVPCPTL
jgi:hypothetical protein